MHRAPVLSLTSALLLALVVAACDKAGAQTAAATAPAAASSAPVQWDFASRDPAKNPDVANQETAVPGFTP
jgi:hypothetical protein